MWGPKQEKVQKPSAMSLAFELLDFQKKCTLIFFYKNRLIILIFLHSSKDHKHTHNLANVAHTRTHTHTHRCMCDPLANAHEAVGAEEGVAGSSLDINTGVNCFILYLLL